MQRRFERAEARVARGRNVAVATQILCEPLGAFELRRRLRRAESKHAMLLQRIDETADQRLLGADDDERNCRLPTKVDDGGVVGDVEIDVFANPRRSRIAGRDAKPLQQRASFQRESNRMFPAARSDQKNIHSAAPVRLSRFRL